MKAREFDEVEHQILGHAPPAIRSLYEVKLRVARERLASGEDVESEVATMRRELALGERRAAPLRLTSRARRT